MTEENRNLLNNTHKEFFDVMLYSFTPEKLKDFVVSDVMGYGTTIDEKVFDLTGLKKLVEIQKEQAEGVDIKFDIAPIHRNITTDENVAIYVDEIEISMQWSEGKNEFGVRISTILEYQNGKWKIIHWHGSKPVDVEEDTWHKDELKKKNEELQRLVIEKTADLTRKNLELEIESALERVRAVAMSMRKPDDVLDVCQIVSDQLELLNVTDIRNIQVAIIDESNKNYLNYQYFTTYSKKVFEETEYENNPTAHAMVSEMQKSANSFYKGSIKDKALQEFKDWRKKYDQYPDPVLDKSSAVYYYFYSIGNGGLGLTTYKKTSRSGIQIFKRFHEVFKLAYQRFIDIENAEAQAREAQIETALERVRSRTMAMQKSEDLQQVVVLLYKELMALGVTNFATCGYVEVNEKTGRQLTWVTNPGGDSLGLFFLPLIGDSVFDERYAAWKQQQIAFHQTVAGDKRIEHLEYAITTFQSKEAEEMVLNQFPDPCIFYCFNFSHGYLHLVTGTELNKKEESLLARFTRVFEQTYARFLDLKNAEAQARETEIQLALEKVRMVALGLNKSEEMLNVAKALYEQLLKLGFSNIRNAIIDINNGDDDTFTDYDYSHDMSGTITQMTYHDDPTLEGQFKKMSTTTNDFFELVLEGKELKDLIAMRIKNGENEDARLNNIDLLSYNLYSFGNGAIGISNFGVLSAEEKSILNRFSNVFTFAYKRYNDLAAAEAQARETQIELSLERIRAQVTAMKESTDLLDIMVMMRTEFVSLGHEAHYFWYMRWLPETYEKAMTSGDGTKIGMIMTLPRHIHGDIKLLADWEKSNEPTVVFAMDVETAIDYIHKMITLGDFVQVDPSAPSLDDIRHIGGLTFIMARTKHGEIGFSLPGTVPDPTQASLDTLVRFAGVFDLAYRRFEDLKDAEQRNRETQIELALERSRTQSMLMQHSDELNKTSQVFHEQLQLLGIDSEFSYLWLPDEAKKEHLFWATWNEDNKGSTIFKNKAVTYPLDKTEPSIAECYTAWESGELVHVNPVGPKEVENYFATWEELLQGVEKFKPKLFPDGIYYVDAYMKYGCFGIMIKRLITEDEKKILSRFSIEFERAYTRFLDLQKAEEQAREAQIEAALERVRSRTMGMQHSYELQDAAMLLFQQVNSLGIPVFGSGFNIWDNDRKAATAWMAGKDRIQPPFKTSSSKDIFLRIHEAAQRGETLFVEEQGSEALKKHYQYMTSIPVFKEIADTMAKKGLSVPSFQIMHCAYFSQGYLMFITFEPASHAHDIFKRFAKVFEQTYTRFLDLKKAEEQTRQAKIETALERVRAKALAMQQPEELKDVAEVLRTEMGLLGIEELETCSIYINDETAEKAECWYAIKDVRESEKILVNDYFKLNLNDTWVGREMLQFYNSSKKQISIGMTGKNRTEWIRYCEEKSVPFRGYYGDVIPDRTYHLYKFSHGAIGAATPGDFSDENRGLLKRVASVFSLAYSRFKDLTQARHDLLQLKEEKKRAEDALSDLRATQVQLIHAEKMASLGELTAGIAHEIQNPLNFVNNFSEVSVDLVEEMDEEMTLGNTEEVKDIASDLKQNLEKIHHHGKRASFIIQGMLEHSRTNPGDKKPTDINVLADEFLRLSYHGLRAKDKSFNADFKTEFDENLPKINAISQDLGRVLLNLINNAFFATSEKAKQNKIAYKPEIIVSTKTLDNTIEIRVKDNGNGIPKDIKDKIFQPFFTTKPTGQGTGLGLSLSYDIITKGHGGTLKVKSKEGKGTEFIIQLPPN